MKRFFLGLAFCLALSLPAIGQSAVLQPDLGGGTVRGFTGGTISSGTNIPTLILHEVLKRAAPFFHTTPDQLIRRYYLVGDVKVIQIGQNLYRVSIGSIGVEILIESARISSGKRALKHSTR